VDALFRIATDGIELSLAGPEEFVRAEIRAFLPHLTIAPPTSGGTPEPDAPPDPDSLPGWYARMVPPGRTPTMQDTILLFGYYLKRVRERHMFNTGDVKHSFRAIGRTLPKSLLQILGTLKRDHGMLWSPEDKRGQYALTPRGIKHVEKLLGIRDEEGKETEAPPAADRAAGFDEIRKAPALNEAGTGGPRSTSEKWKLLFKERGGGRREA
jgi:hypothetical protein